MRETIGLHHPALDFILEQGAATIAEGGAVMLYDNLYALAHIFQMFLQDTAERLDHGEDVLSRGDASYASADATLGSHLLEWLDKRNIVMDAAHKVTLSQIANSCDALASTCADLQPLTAS